MMKRRISVAVVLLFLSATTIAKSAEEVNEETGEMVVNLKSIDAKFDWMRIEAHSIVSKIVRGDDSSFSNDDPDFLDQLFHTSNTNDDGDVEDDDENKSTQLPTLSPSKQSEMSMTPVNLSAHSIVPTEQVITSPTHQHEVNEDDGESITTNEVEYSTSPTANVVAAVNGKPTGIPTVISNIPSISVTNKTYWPTYSPLPLRPHSTNESLTPTLKEVILDVCPPTYNESIWYMDGDDVAIRRKPRCQTQHFQTVYRCKSVYCNIVMPGTRDANKGWSKLGRCNDSVDCSNEASSELESYTPTSNPVTQDIGIVVTTELPTTASTNMTILSSSARPVSSPTVLSNDTKLTYTPTQIVLNEDHDSSNNTIVGYNVSDDDGNLIKMDLPLIISDITLCSSLLPMMKNTRILSSTIRSMMLDLFETLLMQDLVNIWMKVEVELNNETVNSDKTNTTSTVRLHAYYDGTAFFSPQSSTPTYDELSSLLVQYFDATEFERRLSLPFTTGNDEVHNCQDMLVDVNSMYITLDDGLLIPLGLAYEEMFSSSTSTAGATGPTKNVTIGSSSSIGLGSQLIVFLSAITVLACFLATAMYLRFHSNDEEGDVMYDMLSSGDTIAQLRILDGGSSLPGFPSNIDGSLTEERRGLEVCTDDILHLPSPSDEVFYTPRQSDAISPQSVISTQYTLGTRLSSLSDSPNNNNVEGSSNVVIVQYGASPALTTIPSDPFEGLSDMERLTDLESNHSQWETFTDRSTQESF